MSILLPEPLLDIENVLLEVDPVNGSKQFLAPVLLGFYFGLPDSIKIILLLFCHIWILIKVGFEVLALLVALIEVGQKVKGFRHILLEVFKGPLLFFLRRRNGLIKVLRLALEKLLAELLEPFLNVFSSIALFSVPILFDDPF